MREVTVIPYPPECHEPLATGAVKVGDGYGLFVDADRSERLAHSIQAMIAHLDVNVVHKSTTLSVAVDDLRSIATIILRNVCR